jgi:mannose-1-phosphate guanylyltransferase
MSARDLSAIVLAGTHQWSGSSFEKLAPRPLLPVALTPLISYPLQWLCDGGIRQATVCVNGGTRLVRSAVGDGSALSMYVSYHEDATPRGAAGCVRDAGLRTRAQTLVVAGGTTVPAVDLAELLDAHFASGAAMTAVVQGEPPSAAPSPAGLYVVERRVLDHVAPRGFQDIKENLIPALRRAGESVVAYESRGFSPHVLDAQTYLAVNQWMVQRLADEGYGSGLLDPAARVEAGALLVGPVQIGAGARVEAGATIVGPTSIGPDSVIGRNALVARSAVWSRCDVGEGAMVHRSVLGHDAVVPPRARLFNLVRLPEHSNPSALRIPFGRGAKPAPSPEAHTSSAPHSLVVSALLSRVTRSSPAPRGKASPAGRGVREAKHGSEM